MLNLQAKLQGGQSDSTQHDETKTACYKQYILTTNFLKLNLPESLEYNLCT